MSNSSDTPWLTSEQQRHWRAYLSGMTVLHDQLDRDLRAAHDMSLPEYEILVRLSESSTKCLRMAVLATELAHSRSRITHTIGRLEKAGLVERRACTSDGRGIEAVLTDKGFEALEEASHTHVTGVDGYLVANSTPEQLRAIGEVFDKVASQLGGTHF